MHVANRLSPKANLFHTPHKGPPPIYTFLFCQGYIFVFRAALHMVISDFFHLRLGALICEG